MLIFGKANRQGPTSIIVGHFVMTYQSTRPRARNRNGISPMFVAKKNHSVKVDFSEQRKKESLQAKNEH